MKHRRFSIDEVRTMREYAAEGKNPSQIGRLMGRTRQVICRKLKDKEFKIGRPYARVVTKADFKIQIPDHVWADRDRRMALSHRNYTSAFCNDPLPGESELDRRRA